MLASGADENTLISHSPPHLQDRGDIVLRTSLHPADGFDALFGSACLLNESKRGNVISLRSSRTIIGVRDSCVVTGHQLGSPCSKNEMPALSERSLPRRLPGCLLPHHQRPAYESLASCVFPGTGAVYGRAIDGSFTPILRAGRIRNRVH